MDAAYRDAISPPCVRQRGATVHDILGHLDKSKYDLIHFVCGALSLNSTESGGRNSSSSIDQDFASIFRSRHEVFRYLLKLREKNGLNNHVREAVNGRSPLHCFIVWLKHRNHEDAIQFCK